MKITDEMLLRASKALSKLTLETLTVETLRDVLEAAFPNEPKFYHSKEWCERNAQLEGNHEVGAGTVEPQQPAVFERLVVTEEMARELDDWESTKEALQDFVDRHSIQPPTFDPKEKAK